MAITYHAGRRIQGTSTDAITVSGGWKQIGRTTLGNDASTITVSSLADKRYLMVLTQGKTSATNTDVAYQFNGDTTAKYASRQKWNGGGNDYVLNTQNHYRPLGTTGDQPFLNIDYISNKSNKEKLIIGHGAQLNATGLTDTMTREEHVAKWVNTLDSIDEVNAILANGGSGRNYRDGTEIVVLGYDPEDTHTTNFWEELANVDYQGGSALVASTPTFTAKKYLWVQAYVKQASGYASGMTFNGDTIRGSTNYGFRYSGNGGTDVSSGSSTWACVKNYSTLAGGGYFFNAFIVNNASDEKLVIGRTCENAGTTSGTAPNRMETLGKWNDSTNSITKVNIIGESGSGNISNGTQIKVWGSN
tara:strand:+ start:19 stop:1098 length:1080 start_codon:yes stop_codon:yes gene_type:complete